MFWFGLVLIAFGCWLWWVCRCKHPNAVRETRNGVGGRKTVYLVCYDCRKFYELNPKGRLR